MFELLFFPTTRYILHKIRLRPALKSHQPREPVNFTVVLRMQAARISGIVMATSDILPELPQAPSHCSAETPKRGETTRAWDTRLQNADGHTVH